MNANLLKAIELLVGLGLVVLAVFLPAHRVDLVMVGITLVGGISIGAGSINHHDSGDFELLGARMRVLQPKDDAQNKKE